MTILCIHRAKPTWPDDAARPRFYMAIDGVDYWAETDGVAPSANDMRAFISPPVVALAVNMERDRRIAVGHAVSLSTGKTFTVQTRDYRDFRNIQGLSSAGIARIISGDTKTTETFRDADNKDQVLAPAELIEMGLKVAAAVDAIYKASWALKDAQAIPTDYTNDKYWP